MSNVITQYLLPDGRMLSAHQSFNGTWIIGEKNPLTGSVRKYKSKQAPSCASYCQALVLLHALPERRGWTPYNDEGKPVRLEASR